MSYDIYLTDDLGYTLRMPDGATAPDGGTRVVGGSAEAWFNITYNYAPFFRRTLGEKGIRSIYDRRAGDTVAELRAAADSLTGEPDEDYWASTEGNAKAALLGLIAMAEALPDGIWSGD